ncbi:MAG: hypothetical protein Q8P46_15615 [Hyphomicrobiales bacterium]|nr:hypothetical protein [Hyphomicrobiales bacterium]
MIRYTDKFRGRYKTAAASREPGYLAKRMEVYKRRERMRAAAARRNAREVEAKVQPIKPAKKAVKV